MSTRTAKKTRQLNNKRTSGKGSGKKSTKKVGRTKTIEKEAQREEKEQIRAQKKKRSDGFKRIGTIVICAIMVLALGLPVGILSLSGNSSSSTADDSSTISSISYMQKQFLGEELGMDSFLIIDPETSTTVAGLWDSSETATDIRIKEAIENGEVTVSSLIVKPSCEVEYAE